MSTENNAVTFSAVFLAKIPPADSKISQLAEWGNNFHALGLVQGMEGNLSFRTRLGFMITGTGVALNTLSAETVSEVTGVVYGLNRTSVYIKGQVVPSRETILHSQIYEERSDINAIFHVHDSLVMNKAEKLGVLVTTAEKEAGSQDLAQEAINLLKFNKDTRYFVLKNHGVIALGASMDEAGKLIEEMRRKVVK